ncbi:hypothetical protein Ahy_A03g015064 [Arachis hypogaea]|uniref:Aminotransferase-like plant mobile domain-containing protein n=1 Tax=Arachis hypogaea TaxID=3818 RepID=A0A445DZM8_ARAHY|nr:hypothetical protein Ahy_A03g015064 [Arachis hypogaea]
MQHMPAGADPTTLRQYTRCYILQMIGGYLMTDKSNNLVHIRWLLLLTNFDRCRSLSWSSAVFSWTYHSSYFAAHRATRDIVGACHY